MKNKTDIFHKIKFWYRAFKHLQKHGPQVKLYKGEERICANCGRAFTGNYCPACGQNAVIGKFTWKNLFSNVVLSFFSIDTGFWRTTLDLMYRPGYMIRDYLAGHRTPYFKPFQYLFVVAAFILVISQIFYGDLRNAQEQFTQMGIDSFMSAFSPDKEITSSNELDHFVFSKIQQAVAMFMAIEWPETVKRIGGLVYDWYMGNLSSFVVILLPFLYLAQSRTFRKTEVGMQMSGPELVIAMVYICDHWLLLGLFVLLVGTVFQTIYSLVGLFMFAFWAYDLHQLYMLSYRQTIRYTVLLLLRLWFYMWLFALLTGMIVLSVVLVS